MHRNGVTSGGGLAVLSVVLAAAIGIISNVLVGSWGWALLTALLVLVSCLAIVEFLRHRAATAAGGPRHAGRAEQPVPPPAVPGPHGGVTISGSRISGQVAGRDAYQIRIGAGGLVALAATALLLGGGATYLGRTDAAVPERATTTPANTVQAIPTATDGPPASSEATPAPADSGTSSTAVLLGNGRDLDPDGRTNGIADVSFESKAGEGGLSLLNGTELAPIPGDGRPSASVCEEASGYSGSTVTMPISAGYSRCLRTSDGRYGTLSVTSAESSALGGSASIAWTIW